MTRLRRVLLGAVGAAALAWGLRAPFCSSFGERVLGRVAQVRRVGARGSTSFNVGYEFRDGAGAAQRGTASMGAVSSLDVLPVVGSALEVRYLGPAPWFNHAVLPGQTLQELALGVVLGACLLTLAVVAGRAPRP